MIAEIGFIVLDAVCTQIAALDSSVDDDFHVSMNVAAAQMLQPGWVELVAAALKSHAADPRRLQVELAESIVMSDAASVNPVLEDLRRLGVSLSIDDFGTGYGSLASIRNFPLHTLKIDRSFIRDIVTNSGDQAVAKSIIALAHNLGLNVVAAGVETAEQIATLREYGSDAFQGYLASRPISASAFTAYLARHDTQNPN